MLSHTFKSVVKAAKSHAGDKTIYLEAVDAENPSKVYKFEIKKDGVQLTMNINGLDVLFQVEDIEMLELPRYLKAEQFREIRRAPSGKIYENNQVNVQYEIDVFIKLFRLMKERVSFTFFHNKKFYDCYYIDGKLHYVEETEDEYRLMGTDLFKLQATHPQYRIYTINSRLSKYDHGSFLDHHARIAEKLGKKFVKYKYGQAV